MKDLPELLEHFFSIRNMTQKICAPLALEDFGLQPIPDVSPPKWHLAHTSWFFEYFILKEYVPNYKEYNHQFLKLFNSYYNTMGPQAKREHRGGEARPLVSQVMDYRNYVTENIMELYQRKALVAKFPQMLKLLELGIHHEQQHQELLIMDIKFILGKSMIKSVYLPSSIEVNDALPESSFKTIEGGLIEIGDNQSDHFCYCNESPRHKFYINDFQILNRPISNKEYLNFIIDGGYQNPLLWKSDGLEYLQKSGDIMPLYWFKLDGQWMEYTLHGVMPLRMTAPVTHINFFEADAFANWTGDRLPTEQEWEWMARKVPNVERGFLSFDQLESSYYLHPDSDFSSLRGNAWEWTSSSYLPYPGYKRPSGFLEEYNYKFMNGQRVLKGGSYATLRDHYRDGYRNYFYPHQKWAITGLRLAKDF